MNVNQKLKLGRLLEMQRWTSGLLSAASVGILLIAFCFGSLAQAQQAGKPDKAAAANNSTAMSEESLDDTREQLFTLLRMSPKLATVVARDPSLLADESYVSRNNPALEEFLQAHPEIVRNPEFYLFARTRRGFNAGQEFRLESAPAPPVIRDVIPFLVFVFILLALLWGIRVLLENRRWTKVFHQQSEAHNKLIERFGTSEELLNYMRSEAGKRILESGPIPLNGHGLQWNSPLARVLTPLQFGAVFTMVGVGFLILMYASATNQALDLGRPGGFLVFGILALMLGLGLIISAGLSWFFARHLGLLPQNGTAHAEAHGRSN